MKVLFSEYGPDYSRYLYPYVVWGCPEAHETPADLYEAGFHPASPNLERFVLCRHLRVPLEAFRASSENRRIIRRADGLQIKCVPRKDFDYGAPRMASWLRFAEERFGPGIMPQSRLDGLMHGRVITHLLVCTDSLEGDREVGHALLYLEPPRMAHYYYAFYDLSHRVRSLGLYLMTSAVEYFQREGMKYIYLGTCYSQRALYKVQFAGLEFFNGYTWSGRTDDLKFLVRRNALERHLFEEPDFLERHGGVPSLLEQTHFRAERRSP